MLFLQATDAAVGALFATLPRMSAYFSAGLYSMHANSVSPAVVYFPQGTYLVSTPIIAYYYTQLIGDARVPPTLLASADFTGIAVVDANPYIANGQFYASTNNLCVHFSSFLS